MLRFGGDLRESCYGCLVFDEALEGSSARSKGTPGLLFRFGDVYLSSITEEVESAARSFEDLCIRRNKAEMSSCHSERDRNKKRSWSYGSALTSDLKPHE